MHAIRLLRRSFLKAVAVGLAVTAVAHLPPLSIASRIDGALYALWSRLPTAAPPGDVLLVEVASGAKLEELARLARKHGAALLVTTLPEPPSETVARYALGPTEVAIGGRRLLSTAWLDGGHLWARADDDGVVRHDWTVLDDAVPVPSLAYAAAAKLAAASGGELPPNADADPAGRRLRFYPGRPFAAASLASLAEQPERLAGAVVIAGGGTHERTPLGTMPTHELLAHALANYRQALAVDAGSFGVTLAWLAGAALLAALALARPEPLPDALLLPSAVTAGLLGWSGGSFALASLWVPIAGPTLLVLGTAAAEHFFVFRRGAEPAELVRAREAAAAGRLRESWAAYSALPPSASLLTELYALGNAFEQRGERSHAVHVFHRIAQVDPGFRDVAHRLVSADRSDGAARGPNGGREPGRDFPATLDRYQLLEPIGRGAMGCVYLGHDPRINRIVAIKAVDLAAEFEPTELAEASETFQREAETAGRLSHPSIVTIFDVGEAQGFAYIAMEYVKGRHMSDFASPGSLLPPAKTLELLGRAADALGYAHEQNVVHRDIKPANIMYDSVSDTLKITDFGIARLIGSSRTRTGIVLGTPAFMSPEQIEGKNVNGHTDLFALGVSLYQLLTGRLPFRGASMTNLMFVIANEPHEPVTAVRPDLPEWLDRIVNKALAKDPAERYQTGAEMARALREGAAALG